MVHWNAAIMPFVRNEFNGTSSAYKLHEYLAAGKPVVTTPIDEVVFSYGKDRIVRIADTADEFVRELDNCFNDIHDSEWQKKRKKLFANTSWDSTWKKMESIISSQVLRKRLIWINKRIKEGQII
jgi:UDP-galactopyranose mutase